MRTIFFGFYRKENQEDLFQKIAFRFKSPDYWPMKRSGWHGNERKKTVKKYPVRRHYPAWPLRTVVIDAWLKRSSICKPIWVKFVWNNFIRVNYSWKVPFFRFALSWPALIPLTLIALSILFLVKRQLPKTREIKKKNTREHMADLLTH